MTEDQEEELKRHQTSMAETRKLVRDVMQKDWGRGEVVHPEKAKELILQVTIPFWFNNPISTKIFFMHFFLPFLNSSQFWSYFLYFQGLRKIRLGTKLNKAAARYSREGWDRFYLAVTRTDCNYILDLLCELFGDPNPIEFEDLDEPAKKKARTRAAEFKEQALASEGVQDTSMETIVYPTGPLNYSLSVDVNYCPRQEISEFTNCSTGNLVNRTKYYCQMCTYSSFNRDSTYTHTHRHLNVVIGCAHPSCDKKYNAPDGLSKHIKLTHNSKLVPEGIKQEEAEAVVAGLAASSSTQ